MNINELLITKKITKYYLSKTTGVPYTTISDICSGKTEISKCNAITVYYIAKGLGVSIEDILDSTIEQRPSFDLFKSNVCHRLRELGDIDFLIEVLEDNKIETYYQRKWYPESLYLLSMVDYLSRINEIPFCEKYTNIRKTKLKTVLFPSSIISIFLATNNDKIKIEAIENSIPEFIRFNIVESEIRNVI